MMKRSLCVLLCLCAVVLATVFLRPVTVSAVEETRLCQGCQQEIPLTDWTAIGGEQTETLTLEADKHYYLTADLTGTPSSGVLVQGAGCIDLNGFNITAGTGCIAISCNGNTTKIMGTGTVTGTYTTTVNGATIHTANGATVHLYGGTYVKTTGGNPIVYIGESCQVHMYDGAAINGTGTTSTYATCVYTDQETALFRMHGGTISGGTNNSTSTSSYYLGTGGSVRIHYGNFIMDDGAITGGTAHHGGNVSITYGTFTMNGGTISGGTANGVSYGGGNFYIYRGTATMNDGLITEGKTTNKCYGGGNVCILTNTFNMHGGTISYGRVDNTSSARGGGNIYQGSASSVFNMTGGKVEFGYVAKGAGNNVYINDGESILSGNAYIGQKHPDTEGSMSYYVKDGGLTASGKTNFTGGLKVMAGDMYISGGKYYSVYYEGSGTCEITGGNFRSNHSALVADGYEVIKVVDSYEYAVVPKGEKTDTVLVNSSGKESLVYFPLTVFDATKYSHIKVYRDTDVGTTSKEIFVDLNGKNLTVGGTGKVHAFDTANDTYNATACGSITVTGTMELVQDVQAPNGNRYIALTENDKTSMHRLDMGLASVSLRTSSAGIYYGTDFHCDEVLSGKVSSHGVVVSVNNMPGSDFHTEANDTNLYTVSKKAFQSGVTETSVAIVNILRQDLDAATNATRGAMVVYANPYICLDNGAICYVGDSVNAGKQKSDADFTGTAYSLFDLMEAFDAAYDSYNVETREYLYNFYLAWKDCLAGLNLENIGKDMTLSLTVTDGQGYCPVCEETVAWTALDQETYGSKVYGAAANGAHLYLAEDITCTASSSTGFLITPETSGNTACFHLNGHSLTTTKTKPLFGRSGILNVMGSGDVSGYAAANNYGATVQSNCTSSKGIINLYGGTYRHGSDAGSGSYVVAIRTNGGAINIYKGAYIDGSMNGKGVYLGTTTSTNAALGLYNTRVDGDVYMAGSTTTKINKLTLESATINGTLDVNSVCTVTLRGAPVITTLDIANTSLVTLDNLTNGASIAVRADGCFTEENANAASYLKYFTAANDGDYVTEENNTLLCKVNYSAKLKLDNSNSGYCAKCNAIVTWAPLGSAAAPVQLTDGQHLYLTAPLTYEGSEAPFITAPATAGQAACLHLNGNNITATQNTAIYSDCGTVNVMGSGTVSGFAATADCGAAVYVNAATATANLCSGTYAKYAGSHASAGAVVCGNAGGTLNLLPDAVVSAENDRAVAVGTCESADANLTIDGAQVKGAVVLNTPTGTHRSVTTVDSATIDKLQVAAGTDVTLASRPKIGNMIVPKETLVNLSGIVDGAAVGVTAEGAFTPAYSDARVLEDYFTAANTDEWIVVQHDMLTCLEKATLPNGNKILVVGNSQTYYGKYVIDKGHVRPLTNRRNDQGYLYQVFKSNGVDAEVTNFTFGNHVLKDFYSGKCAADRGHNGYNHLTDLMVDRNYDYVIFQEGTEASSKENIYAECKPLMDFFREGNPDTKFVFLVPQTAFASTHVWLPSVKELEENGVIVVDWGKMVQDLIDGNVTAPGATQTFGKFSFVVNKSKSDQKHPNILSGYLAAQMTYCAITGESAVGNDWSFWNDTAANTAFSLSAYKSTYYAYDKTNPSNTNFEAIFTSTADMEALHALIDQYLKEKPYLDYATDSTPS